MQTPNFATQFTHTHTNILFFNTFFIYPTEMFFWKKYRNRIYWNIFLKKYFNRIYCGKIFQSYLLKYFLEKYFNRIYWNVFLKKYFNRIYWNIFLEKYFNRLYWNVFLKKYFNRIYWNIFPYKYFNRIYWNIFRTEISQSYILIYFSERNISIIRATPSMIGESRHPPITGRRIMVTHALNGKWCSYRVR